MTEPDATAQRIAAVWAQSYTETQIRVVSFDREHGRLIVECANRAWHKQLELLGGLLITKLNKELGTPIVQSINAKILHTRVLITGSRSWADPDAVEGALFDTWHDLTQVRGPWALMRVVHGACPNGADAQAAAWAARQTPDHVSAEAHPADWNAHGRGAGFLRNADMVRLGAAVCLAFIKNGSRGATHTADLAEKAGIPVRRFTA